MGYSSLLYAIGAIAMGGLLLFSLFRSTNEANTDQAAHFQQTQARTAARTGVQLAARLLADADTSWAIDPIFYSFDSTAYGDAAFRVNVIPVGATPLDWRLACGPTADSLTTVDNRIKLRAIGYAPSARSLFERVEIDVCYEREFVSPGIPPAFARSLFAGGNLTINQDTRILALQAGDNANVHANGNLDVFGPNETVEVQGYGTYVGFGPPGAKEAVFIPPTDENGEEGNMYQLEGPISAPSLQVDHYRNPGAVYCQGSDDPNCGQYGPPVFTVSGDTTIAGGEISSATLGCMDCGTDQNPITYFVDGNLSITGDLTVIGYVQLIVNGQVQIGGNVTAVSTSPPTPTASDAEWNTWAQSNLADGETTIGLYADGTITVQDDMTVVGQLFSNGAINLNDGSVVVGGVTALSDVTTTANQGGAGTPSTVRYAPIAKRGVLPGQQWNVPGGVILASYSEWTTTPLGPF